MKCASLTVRLIKILGASRAHIIRMGNTKKTPQACDQFCSTQYQSPPIRSEIQRQGEAKTALGSEFTHDSLQCPEIERKRYTNARPLTLASHKSVHNHYLFEKDLQS